MFNLRLGDIITKLKDSNEKTNEIEMIIKPFLSNDLAEKQKIELCHVGKFLSLLNNQAEIIQRSESPDFIIAINGVNIGLEHERIFNKVNVKPIKSASKLFSDSAILFQQKYPEIKLLANFWLNTERLEFSKNDTLKLKTEIVAYTYSQYVENNSAKKPEYIDDVMIMEHSKVSFNYNPGAYYVTNLKSDDLKNAVLKKEMLLKKYRANTKLDKQWLLIVIGSTSPDSFEIGDDHSTFELESNFDKIFLMEDFNSVIWEIK